MHVTSKVAVIGAGAAGLAMARQLSLLKIPFEVLEKGSDIGGNWRMAPDNDHSGVFASTHANTSRQIMAFSDCDMPDDYPVYPHHSQLLAYLRQYATRFGLLQHIQTNQWVISALPIDGGKGGWELNTGSGDSRRYRALCVAIGHHWSPRLPNIPGTFSGRSLHSKEYRSHGGFAGQRVLLVGLGASGADIAVDLSHVAGRVDVSVRRGYHIVPKIVMGRPLDHFAFEKKKSFLPGPLRRQLTDKLLGALIGDPSQFGFPRPTHALRDVSPTISQELLGRIAQGSVRVRPALRLLDGDTVHFADGLADNYDALIYATGYQVVCPFLTRDILNPEEPFRMYKHVIHPNVANLFFIGFVQPLGGFWPVAEAQSQWVAAILDGRLAPVPSDVMREDVNQAWKRFQKKARPSSDTFLQVEQDAYLRELWQAMVPAGPIAKVQQTLRRVAPFTELVWKRIEQATGRETNGRRSDNGTAGTSHRE